MWHDQLSYVGNAELVLVRGSRMCLCMAGRKCGIFQAKNILKNLTWQLLIITILCVLWDHFTGWKGWSIDFVFPFGTLTVLGSIPVIAGVSHLETEEYLYYLLQQR